MPSDGTGRRPIRCSVDKMPSPVDEESPSPSVPTIQYEWVDLSFTPQGDPSTPGPRPRGVPLRQTQVTIPSIRCNTW
jgi:hypothetical protein